MSETRSSRATKTKRAVSTKKRATSTARVGESVSAKAQSKVSKVTKKRVSKTKTEQAPSAVFSGAEPISLTHTLTARIWSLPVDLNTAMVHTARLAGAACAFVGALFILQYAPLAFSALSIDAVLQTSQTTSSFSSPLATNDATTVSTTTSGNVNTTSVVTTQNAYLELIGPVPLKDIITLRAVAPNAKKIDFYVFSGSWNNKAFLGTGTQVHADVWEFQWDSRKVPDNTDYRFIAYVWDTSAVSDRYDYDLQLLTYYTVQNAQATQATPTSVAPDPTISVKVGTIANGELPLYVQVQDATQVELRAENIDTGVRYALPAAVNESNDTWKGTLTTANYVSGNYRIWARVTVNNVVYLSQDVTTSIVVAASTKPTTMDTTSAMPTVPTLTLVSPQTGTVSGNVDLRADIAAASFVNFYIQDLVSASPRFIGSAINRSNSTTWTFNWYTLDVPNGAYKLFARAVTDYGTVESNAVAVDVRNIRTPIQNTKVQTLVDEVAVIEDELGTSSGATITTLPTTTESGEYDFFVEFLDEFRAELQRLGTAVRSKDRASEARIRERLDDLLSRVLAASEFADDVTRVEQFKQWYRAAIDAYLSAVQRVDALIAERRLVNVLLDSDLDGISNFDETSIYGTDPFAADTDGDGVVDGVEIMGGFDPLDPERQVPVRFESAEAAGQVRSDILSVTQVLTVEPDAQSTSTEQARAVFTGTGLPNSFVTLYIYSTPIVVTVKTDDDGTWRYRFDKELEDGEHTMYVGMTDNAGRIIAKSEPFLFAKNAQAISPLVEASLQAPATPPEQTLLATYMIYLVLSVSVVAIGLVLLLLGLHLDRRRSNDTVTTQTA